MIYADCAATTSLSRKALSAMMPYLTRNYGNPSSPYAIGRAAHAAVMDARQEIAQCLGCSRGEILFTSGGSESDNLAILSAAHFGKKLGKHTIITTNIEHPAVLNPLRRLEEQGFRILRIPVDEDGLVKVDQIQKAIGPDTCLVSVMMANNEIGTLQPIRQIGEICRRSGILFHTDAVQAVGHLPISLRDWNVDLLSFSAHKFHGPKGVGGLYCRRGVELTPLILGGSQERRKRAGTENVAGIGGMAAALRESCDRMAENTAKVRQLRDMLLEGLLKIPHTALNGAAQPRLPGNINLCIEDALSENLLVLLDRAGICVSGGSACSSGSLEPSHVLLAIGRPEVLAFSGIRITLDEENTAEEIPILLHEITRAVEQLRSTNPEYQKKQNGEKPFLLP